MVMNDAPINSGPDQTGAPKTRDYFAEMYVAGVLADAGWDIYFPRRDRGFDMIVSRPAGDTTIVRPVQVKGKYASDEKTNKASYGYVGRMTAFHPGMILAIPYFSSRDASAPMLIAWMPRHAIRPHTRGWKCEPARFVKGVPEPRPSFAHYFGEPGLMPFLAGVGVSTLWRRPFRAMQKPRGGFPAYAIRGSYWDHRPQLG